MILASGRGAPTREAPLNCPIVVGLPIGLVARVATVPRAKTTENSIKPLFRSRGLVRNDNGPLRKERAVVFSASLRPALTHR